MFRPYAFADRLADVSLETLARDGFTGLIVDLDNTLLAYGETVIRIENLAWIARAKELGFRIVVVSNNFTQRVAVAATKLDVPAIPNALKPLPFGLYRALRMLGTPRRGTLVVGDQLMTDIIGASLIGVRGVLTRPIADRDFPLTRVLRRIERVLLALSGGRQ